MIACRDAFSVLDAIHHGDLVETAAQRRWVDALMTIRWVEETPRGFALTGAGHRALAEAPLSLLNPDVTRAAPGTALHPS